MAMIDKEAFTTNVPFHGSKGIIFIGEKIIVFRRDTKTNNFPLMVDLPGGGIEGKETPFETFARESFEEFGVVVIKEDVVYARQYPGVIDPRQSFFFVTKPKNLIENDVVFGDEGLEWFCLDPREFISLSDGVPRQQERVQDYLSSIGGF
jgi:8-oxo-dGTP diphosphatase